jgi:hypothetical protein
MANTQETRDTYALYHIDHHDLVFVVTAGSWDDARRMVADHIMNTGGKPVTPKDIVGRKHVGPVLRVQAIPMLNGTTM